jgi:hypothetical protein
LIDAIATPTDLISAARLWALQIADHRRPWVKSIFRTDKLPSPDESREILKFARARAQKQAPNVKHPLVCMDVIEEGIVSGPHAGLLKVLLCNKLPCWYCAPVMGPHCDSICNYGGVSVSKFSFSCCEFYVKALITIELRNSVAINKFSLA